MEDGVCYIQQAFVLVNVCFSNAGRRREVLAKLSIVVYEFALKTRGGEMIVPALTHFTQMLQQMSFSSAPFT